MTWTIITAGGPFCQVARGNGNGRAGRAGPLIPEGFRVLPFSIYGASQGLIDNGGGKSKVMDRL